MHLLLLLLRLELLLMVSLHFGSGLLLGGSALPCFFRGSALLLDCVLLLFLQLQLPRAFRLRRILLLLFFESLLTQMLSVNSSRMFLLQLSLSLRFLLLLLLF